MEKKMEVINRIFDDIRAEAPASLSSTYNPDPSNIEAVRQARAHAYIHLFLKGQFGIDSFEKREQLITDGSYDGGIDAYYIDENDHVIYFVQSKCRNSEDGWEKKEITLGELLLMQIHRVLSGEKMDEAGYPYNNRILEMVDRIKKIEDITEYKYVVVILANLKTYTKKELEKIVGKYEFEVFDSQRYWDELVFPLISGRLAKAEKITFKLSFKNTGDDPGYMKYVVKTKYGKCKNYITYVPTKEIGELLYKYKNSVLEFNPRCYLGFKKNTVNSKIKSSVVDLKTNDFSLMNNGITIMADKASVASIKINPQISMTNPQIINGGQTAYTLSSIYEECSRMGDYSKFDNKSVLVRVISIEGKIKEDAKLGLIDSLSKATNEQSPVDYSDKKSNKPIIVNLQKEILDNYGLFLRRKTGEFLEGENKGYIDSNKVVDIVTFIRLAFSASGDPSKARRSGEKVLFDEKSLDLVLPNLDNVNKYMFAYYCLRYIFELEASCIKVGLGKFGVRKYGNAFRYAKYAVVYACVKSFDTRWPLKDYNSKAKKTTDIVLAKWKDYENVVKSDPNNSSYYNAGDFNYDGYYKGKTLNDDITAYSFM